MKEAWTVQVRARPDGQGAEGYHSPANDPTPPLSTLRTQLINAYPPVGPIFA